MISQQLKDLFRLKAKFAASSAIATVVDYCLYLLLVSTVLTPVYANIISAGIGMLINFVLQKNYIFDVNRSIRMAFLISLATSLVGLTISTYLIYELNKFQFFSDYQMITKALVTGTIFFYNFYFKRFAFEKKML